MQTYMYINTHVYVHTHMHTYVCVHTNTHTDRRAEKERKKIGRRICSNDRQEVPTTPGELARSTPRNV